MTRPAQPPGDSASTRPPREIAPCRRRPNCVSTRGEPGPRRLEPLPFRSAATARERLLALLAALPRTTVVVAEEIYLRAEVRSRLFRFVDDLELLINDGEKQVHFRSASRVGRWDLGVNRRRMERIRRLFLEGGPV
jgi:uncharacterized protein (DUF1499 family)